jgi:hypothetical protein
MKLFIGLVVCICFVYAARKAVMKIEVSFFFPRRKVVGIVVSLCKSNCSSNLKELITKVTEMT